MSNGLTFKTLLREILGAVKDLKPTHRPETGNLYPGSVIDTLATVRLDSDRSEPKRSLNVYFSNFSLKVPPNALRVNHKFQ